MPRAKSEKSIDRETTSPYTGPKLQLGGKNATREERLQRIREYVQSRGGTLQHIDDGDITRRHTYVTLSCGCEKHAPRRVLVEILATGSWCKACALEETRKRNVARFHQQRDGKLKALEQHATEKGGFLVAGQTFVDMQTKLWWRCGNEAHQPWESTPATVVTCDAWCPQCASESRKIAPDELHALARQHGGALVDVREYKGNDVPLRWKCRVAEHEVFLATASKVRHRGQWCPLCAQSVSVGERIVRLSLQEAVAPLAVVKTRSVKGLGGLELDCFIHELMIGFEYDGRQHTKFIPLFHKTMAGFLAQKERDRLKAERCEQVKITLLRVDCETPPHEIRDTVRALLQEHRPGFQLQPKVLSDEELMAQVHMTDKKAEDFKCFVQHVQRHGGTTDAKSCPSTTALLPVKCAQYPKHPVFTTSLNRLSRKGNHWCRQCARENKSRTDDDVRQTLQNLGHEVISFEHRPSTGGKLRRYVTIRCAAGHPTRTVPMSSIFPLKEDGKMQRNCPLCIKDQRRNSSKP